jgi:hypothetical protein
MNERNQPAAECAEFYDVRALTAVEVATAVRHSLAQCMAELFPPSKGTPARLGALLARLDQTADPH